MAKYRNVKEFLSKIREVYETARAEYTVLNDKLQNVNESWNAELSRGWANISQRQADTQKYESIKADLQREIRELIQRSYAEFEKIKLECEEVFSPYDRATGSKIDLTTLELLKSGILREDEIKALAIEYDGNCTMLRLIGKYAIEQGTKYNNNAMRNLGTELQNYHFPYREHIDELIRWSKKGLREDREVSDRMALFYNQTADEIFSKAEGIYITVSE